MKLVLDTSILIDHLRGGSGWKQILAELEEDTELFIPTIVFFELFSGKSSKNIQTSHKILNLVKSFQKIELDEQIARRAGEIYRDVTTALDVSDYIIAASTLGIGASVVTLNKKHFQQIPGISIYPK